MMKNLILTVILVLSLGLNSINSNAAPVGSAFSYQGELIDNGTPANGLYDFFITAKENATNPSPDLANLQFNDIQITNGLFTIPLVDLGDSSFTGDDLWLAVGIRQAASVIGSTSFTFMDTWQRVNAVPYAVQAEFLAPNGANNGDVLQFNGSDWVPSAVSVSSPWTDNGASVSYLGRVGVGVTNNLFGFQIKGSGTQHPFEVTDASGVGILRVTDEGKIGVRTTAPQAQMHIFSPTGSSPLKIDVGASTALSIDGNARAKIGNDTVFPTFNAKLAINEADGGHPLSVKKDGLLELLVERDGGVSIGSNFSGTFPPELAPDRGLYVFGDIKTSNQNNGLMKYMVSVYCGDGANANIQKSYTAVTSGGTPTIRQDLPIGQCEITFPSTVNDRYVMALARDNTFASKTVNCGFISTDTLKCFRTKSNTTSGNTVFESGNIDIFIY